MKQPSTAKSGFLQLLVKQVLQNLAAKFESPRKREFKKLKRFIAGC